MAATERGMESGREKIFVTRFDIAEELQRVENV